MSDPPPLPSPPSTSLPSSSLPSSSLSSSSLSSGSLPSSIDQAELTIPRIIQPDQRLGHDATVQPLGRRLVEAGLLREDQLATALAHQASEEQRLQAVAAHEGTDGAERIQRKRFKRLGEVIAELGLVDEAKLLPMLGEQLGVEGVKLREGLVDPLTLRLVPRSYAQRYRALPLARVRDELTVAMADPQDLAAIDALADVSGCSIRPVLTLASGIEQLLPQCYTDDLASDQATENAPGATWTDPAADRLDLDTESDQQLSENSPVTNVVNYVVIQAVRQHASDIHIEAGAAHTSIRFRIDGTLREIMRPHRDAHAAIVSRIKMLAHLNVADHQCPQTGLLRVRISRRDVDLRVNTLPTVLGEKVVMRVHDTRHVAFDLDRLGMPTAIRKRFCQALDRPSGLILLTGPSGCGKTTTLYAALERIKGVGRNLITVEDLVEYRLELVNQIQVAADHGVTFASALNSILQLDPDALAVASVTDRSTAESAIEAAHAGKLVLAGMRVRDGASAIVQLLRQGVDGSRLASCLQGALAQQLVRKLCPQCRESDYPPRELLHAVHYHGDARRSFAQPRGCSQCHDSGYRGRTGVFEWFDVTAKVRGLIADGTDTETLRRQHQGPTLHSEGIRLAETNTTSLQEVQRVLPIDWTPPSDSVG